jgi:hypothetical protein
MTEHHGRKGARRKYKFPVQKYANQTLKVMLFCGTRGCNNYTQGVIGYNGAYTDEDGSDADLRNQWWVCSRHAPKDKKVK